MSGTRTSGGFDPAEYWESRHELTGFAAVGHMRLGEPFNRWAYLARRKAFLRAVRPLVDGGPPRRVLDVGSGKGFYIERWAELGVREIAGCDLSETAVEGLRRRFPGRSFTTVDIGAPLEGELPGPFDAVSAFDVLFHLVDDDSYRQAFRNLSDLLVPDGFAVFSEHLLDGRTRRAEAWVKRSREDTDAALRDAGLVQVARTPMFFLMNPPSVPGPTVHRRAWRVLSQAIRRYPGLGAIAGAALYPIEVVLGRVRSDGPSTHIVVCRKRA